MLVFAAFFSQSQVKVPLFFADSMVLQRNTQASIWGTDVANRKIIVTGSWGAKDSTVSSNLGNWKLKINTPNAGGPFTVTIVGSTTVTIRDVYVGEVWLCSGQSNMEMPMKGYTNSTPPQTVDSSSFFIANSLNPNLRVYMSGWNGTSRTPVTTLTNGKWETASPYTTPDFSALAYFFGRKLQAALGIPVGLIVTSRGGATIESWMDSTSLASIKPVIIPATVPWQDAQETHTILYNTMLHPFIGYNIKGVIWSQGESNIGTSNYQQLFTKLIESWRSQWGIGSFPFYFTQIAPTGNNTDVNAARLREAQLHTFLSTTNTGLAVTLDIGDQAFTHYPKKKPAGDRLANWALVKNYGFNGIPSGPIFKTLTIKNDTLNLRFDYTGNGLTSFGIGLSDFEIAGANKVFYPATVSTANFNFSINLRSSNVAAPLYARYGFKNWVQGSLFNVNGLPASPFRTEQMLDLYTLLPVVFDKINVSSQKKNRVITWNVLAETNIKMYEVEVSSNGTNFKQIGSILAEGTSKSYSFFDDQNQTINSIYYRIKAVNKNGEFEYSKIVTSSLNALLHDVSIVNPSSNTIKINFIHKFSGDVIVNNTLGQNLVSQKIYNKQGNLNLYLPFSYKGMAYVSLISSKNEKHSFIINVQ